MKNGPAGKKKSAKAKRIKKFWLLKLYVAGRTPKAMMALTSLREICEEHIRSEYRIMVVDILKNPALAKSEQIVAIPTLVKQCPLPVKKFIGNLTDKERILVALDLKPAVRLH